jgi:hypothetical protein
MAVRYLCYFIDNKTIICHLSPDSKRKTFLPKPGIRGKPIVCTLVYVTGDIIVGMVKSKLASIYKSF